MIKLAAGTSPAAGEPGGHPGTFRRHDRAPDSHAGPMSGTAREPGPAVAMMPLRQVGLLRSPDVPGLLVWQVADGVIRERIGLRKPDGFRSLADLAADIRLRGILEPLEITASLDGDAWLYGGHHRYVAAVMDGHLLLPVRYRTAPGLPLPVVEHLVAGYLARYAPPGRPRPRIPARAAPRAWPAALARPGRGLAR